MRKLTKFGDYPCLLSLIETLETKSIYIILSISYGDFDLMVWYFRYRRVADGGA